MTLEIALDKAAQDGSTQFGFWLTIPSGALARTILRSNASSSSAKKFSWVLVDAEHGFITDQDYYELSAAIGSEGASPIIRVPWNEEWMIKRALDAGAHGILTPMCHSEQDAAKIVQFCKYPPLGSRGYGPAFSPHAFPGLKTGATYEQGANEKLKVMVQIESKAGVENVEKIAQVEGLDVLLIGPFDLSKQLQVERGGEEHEAAIKRILAAAHAAGKKAAIYCTSGKDAQNRAQQGFDMVSVASIEGALAEKLQAELDVATGQDGSTKVERSY